MSNDRIPCNLIDESFVNLDDPAQPLTVQLEVGFDHRFDEGRLGSAVGAGLAQHPLARARLEPWTDATRGYDWIVDSEPQVDPFSVRTVDSHEQLDALRGEMQSQPLALFESPPLRIRLVHAPDGDVLMLVIHHAAADGVGSLRLLQSVVRAYAGVEDPIPDIHPADAPELATPDESISWSDGLDIAKMELRRMSRMASLPARLSPEGESGRTGYGIHSRSRPVAALAASPLRKELGATVNDVLIAALARTAGSWIDEHDPDGEAGRVSVTMPINARPPEWSTEVVRNLIASDAVSTSREERADAEQCLAAVAGWTEAVKQRGPGLMLSALGSTPPGGVSTRRTATKWAMRVGGPLADTLVLTNLGRLPADWIESADIRPTGVWVSPPAPMPAGLGIGVCSVGDTLCLTYRHHWALWSDEAVQRFAWSLEDELDAMALPHT